MPPSRQLYELPFEGPRFFTFGQKLSFYTDYPIASALLFAFVLVLTGYFVFIWKFRRPVPRPMGVRVKRLPEWISPAALRYVAQKGFDTKCILVCLMNAGVKGCYRIRWASKGFMALRNAEGDFSLLTEDERRTVGLYPDHYRDRVFISKENTRMTRNMSENMDRYFRKSFRRFFKRRIGWLIGGIVAAEIMSASVLLASGMEKYLFIWACFHVVLWLFVILPVFFFSLIFRDRYWFGMVYCVLFLIVGIYVLSYIEISSTAPSITVLTLPLLVIPFLFAPRLPVYTDAGQRLMNMAAAYRGYLTEQMQSIESEGGSLKEMAEDLPFVLAMDMEDKFTPYFRNLLSHTRYEPYQVFDRMHH